MLLLPGAVALRRAGFTVLLTLLALAACQGHAPPERLGLVVLTFDDAVKSHRTLVAPLLKELGFGATFFITQRWMDDAENFLTWEEVAEIHGMGFEIGNHSWSHLNFSRPHNAALLPEELGRVEEKLADVGVPRPVSFAYSGNAFGPEAVAQLERLGYQFARRGMQPEVPYGQAQVGPPFDPGRHHRLLIPTTGDAYPNWTLQHFRQVVAPALEGKFVVLQFHGVPDLAHPWVHTPPERFREYMLELKAMEIPVVALRDLESVLPRTPPDDPALTIRYQRRE